jgi:hypothetical protein
MASLLPRYIPQAGLDALAKYKYSAEDHSFLKKLFLGAYWDWAIGLFPLWIAYVLIAHFFHWLACDFASSGPR